MNLLSSVRLATTTIVCAALVSCASVEPAPPTVIRTPAPLAYEKTISDYFAFRIRGSQKNTEVSFGALEPGACPLDGYLTSTRGWVVPVVRATRSGEATGRETVHITTRQYYFWFLGNTIAGITPRIELCPGVGASVSEDAPASAVAVGMVAAALPVVTPPDAPRRLGAELPDASANPGASASAKPVVKTKAKAKAKAKAKRTSGSQRTR